MSSEQARAILVTCAVFVTISFVTGTAIKSWNDTEVARSTEGIRLVLIDIHAVERTRLELEQSFFDKLK